MEFCEFGTSHERKDTGMNWIHVDERMPEKNMWCLVCYEGLRMPVGNMSHWFDGNRFHNIGPWAVTHWQPLPEPPKE